MAKATIAPVSKDELAQAHAFEKKQTPAVSEHQVDVQPKENRRSLYSTEFIKKLKIEEIEKFFEPFGLISCAKIPNEQEPKFVLVSCSDFQVVFSDYSQVFDFNGGFGQFEEAPESKFNLGELSEYCMITGTTPEQAISELMVTNLFGKRFNDAYFENWKNAKQKETKIAFSQMSKPMQKMFANVQEKNEQTIASTRDKLYFGEYAGGYVGSLFGTYYEQNDSQYN